MRFRRISDSSKRRGVSPLIATLLLIAIAVAAAVVLYAFVTGLITNFTSGGPSYLVTGNGEMVVPGSTDLSGILSITVKNEGSQPIKGVTLACSSPPFNAANCDGLIINYSGNPISAGPPGPPLNLLPINGLGTGSVAVTAAALPGFTAGTSYQVVATLDFVGGSTQIIVINVLSTS